MELQPTGRAPSERFGHSAVYDPHSHSMVVFGGWGLPLRFLHVSASRSVALHSPVAPCFKPRIWWRPCGANLMFYIFGLFCFGAWLRANNDVLRRHKHRASAE